MKNEKYLVVFEPFGLKGYVEEGKTLLEAARGLGVGLESICGGQAKCGKCRVEVLEGLFENYHLNSRVEHLSPVGETERQLLAKASSQAQDNLRLACLAHVYGEVAVFIPEESRAERLVVSKSITGKPVALKPAVRKYYVELSPPTLEEPLGDWERLSGELDRKFDLKDLSIDYRILKGLPEVMRQGEWQVTVSVWSAGEVIKVEPGYVEGSFGLAVDLGTTTVAGYLCDLDSGDIVADYSVLNPQLSYGEDVMSRITYVTTSRDGLNKLNRLATEAINRVAEHLAHRAGISPQDILDTVIVGNTCMHHILVGLDPQYLGRAPFTPAIHHSLDIKAHYLGLKIAPGAYVHLLPIEAGFVGADNVAVLIAEEPYSQDEMILVIDIGTNGELVLGNRERLISCSCATGPAFEGAGIKYGMRAAPGAIEKMEIDPVDKEVRFKVISKTGWNTELKSIGARGICGSGVIDAVAQMFLAGVIQANGRLNTGLETPRLRVTEEGAEFVIAWAGETSTGEDITISQADISAVQLAKGALYAGAKILMHHRGVEKLDRVILAGAFGSCIDKKSALVLGLFPDCPLNNVYSVGNAAGEGARLALLSLDKRGEAGEVSRKVEYLELTLVPEFEEQFTQAMYIPHLKDNFPRLNS